MVSRVQVHGAGSWKVYDRAVCSWAGEEVAYYVFLTSVSSTWKAYYTVADWVILAQVVRRDVSREGMHAAS